MLRRHNKPPPRGKNYLAPAWEMGIFTVFFLPNFKHSAAPLDVYERDKNYGAKVFS